MLLIEYVQEHLENKIKAGEKVTLDFAVLLAEFKQEGEEANRKKALVMINAALSVEKLYMIYNFAPYGGGGRNADDIVDEQWIDTADSERVKIENPSKRAFINSIFNSQINSHCLSQCMLLVSDSLKPEEQNGFKALRTMEAPLQSNYGETPFPKDGYRGQKVEVREECKPHWEETPVATDNNLPTHKRFNNVLAATIAAEEITKPNELARIKQSFAYTIANTRRIAVFLNWFSTNTVKRIETAKRFMPTESDNQTVVEKLLDALNNKDTGILAQLEKDRGRIAQNKKKVLSELSAVLAEVKKGTVSASDAFQTWKKSQNAENCLGKNRTALWGKTKTLEFMKDAEVALAAHPVKQ